jgi:predicted nucleic acid-binding protein
VAVKWFTPEVLQAQALHLRNLADELVSVDYTMVEVASALIRKVRGGIYEESALSEDLRALKNFMDYYPATDFVESAFRIAVTHHCSIYDSLYVSLSLEERCQLVTADEKLYNSLRDVYPGRLLWLGDVTAEMV